MSTTHTRRDLLKGGLAVAGLGVLGMPEFMLPARHREKSWCRSRICPRPSPLQASIAGNHPYDGRVTFVRIRYTTGFGGFGRRGSFGEPPWAHDYPTADTHVMKIVNELTLMRPRNTHHSFTVQNARDDLWLGQCLCRGPTSATSFGPAALCRRWSR